MKGLESETERLTQIFMRRLVWPRLPFGWGLAMCRTFTTADPAADWPGAMILRLQSFWFELNSTLIRFYQSGPNRV